MVQSFDLPVDYNNLSRAERKLVREQYIKEQGGNCHHCLQPLSGEPDVRIALKYIDQNRFPVGFLLNPVHLHHNHQTRLTIGAVHARCNAVLFQYHGE